MPAASWPRCWSACRPSAVIAAASGWPNTPKTPHSSRNRSPSKSSSKRPSAWGASIVSLIWPPNLPCPIFPVSACRDRALHGAALDQSLHSGPVGLPIGGLARAVAKVAIEAAALVRLRIRPVLLGLGPLQPLQDGVL